MISHESAKMYDGDLKDKFLEICTSEKIICREGVFCCLQGPAYETNSEIRMLRKMKVDAVGMSTIPELIEAHRLGIRTIELSVITNLLIENRPAFTLHNDVIESAHKSFPSLSCAIKRLLLELN